VGVLTAVHFTTIPFEIKRARSGLIQRDVHPDRFPGRIGEGRKAHCRSLGFARDDKGRGVTQVGVVSGCRENNRVHTGEQAGWDSLGMTRGEG
jgi:hypothetical protein